MRLPRSITEANDIHQTLLKESELGPFPYRPHVRVDSLTVEGFDLTLHGWRVRLNKDVWEEDGERAIPEYSVHYTYRGVTVGYSPLAFRFPRRRHLTDDLILYWNGQIGPSWRDLAEKLKFQEEKLSWPSGNTGELIEHLWREGYQFEEYLPGSYLPDVTRGNMLVDRMQHPDNEKYIMSQLRQWYLTQLAITNLKEVDQAEEILYLSSSSSFRPANTTQDLLLRKVCESVIDNKLDNPEDELEHLALRWVSLVPEEF